jgi:hypothetical protein
VRPYYEHAGITLFHGDCRDFLPHLTADLLCIDPPYGTNEHGGYGRRQLGLQTIVNDDDVALRDEILTAWGERPAIVFGSPRRPEPPGRWDFRLVWDKRVPGLGAPWRWQHEMIYLRGAWKNPIGIPSVLSGPLDRAMRERWHPHEKPVEVMTALLAGTAGVIVDPCAGSGSTLVAAKNLGRAAFGVEIEERHCEVIAKRLAQEVLALGVSA